MKTDTIVLTIKLILAINAFIQIAVGNPFASTCILFVYILVDGINLKLNE